MRRINTHRSKNELVYHSIREAIIQGEFPPGERIIIDETAEQLGVSQIPVREALRQLESDGFVVIKPYVGATVTEIQTSLISEIFGLLESMEVISGRAACERFSEADLANLKALLLEMDDLMDDPVTWSRQNVRFHELICDRAETPLVKILMSKALDHWGRLHNYYFKDVFVRRMAEAQRQHWSMYEAIQQRDPDQLERLVHEHNRTALAAYTAHLETL